jgi:hypothetical protein
VVADIGDVAVHRIIRQWDQSVDFTFVKDRGGFFEYDGIGRPVDMSSTEYDWQIRKIVQAWADGLGNNGILIAGDTLSDIADVEFDTDEGGFAPELHVRYY